MAAQLASWTIDWCSSGCQGWANGKGRRGRVSWWEGSPPAPYSLTPIGLAREHAGRLVEEGAEAVRLPVVPAEVAVEGDRVGDGHEGVRGPEEARRGRRSARVLLLRERLELLHVRELRGPAAPRLRELVVEAPQEDRGVVHPLADHLPQLLLAVLAEGGGVGVAAHEAVHERDLDPGQEPRAIAQLEEVLGVRVVGEAHRVRPHLEDESDVALVIGRGRGRSPCPPSPRAGSRRGPSAAGRSGRSPPAGRSAASASRAAGSPRRPPARPRPRAPARGRGTGRRAPATGAAARSPAAGRPGPRRGRRSPRERPPRRPIPPRRGPPS